MVKSLFAVTIVLAGMVMGCSDPMYPNPKLPPIVIPRSVLPPPVDRSLLTVILPTSKCKGGDCPPMGPMREKSRFNAQWVLRPEDRVVDGKQDDVYFASCRYFITVYVPQSDGKELIASGVGDPTAPEVDKDGVWSYRISLTAPEQPGRYVVRLSEMGSKTTLSESILEVFDGDESGR